MWACGRACARVWVRVWVRVCALRWHGWLCPEPIARPVTPRTCRLLVDWLGFLLDRFKATQRCKTINGYTKNVDKSKRVVDYLLSTDNPTPERANHLRSVRAMLDKVGADVAHSYRSGMHVPKLVVSNPAPALAAGPGNAPESEDVLPDKEALLRFQRRLQEVSSRAQRCASVA